MTKREREEQIIILTLTNYYHELSFCCIKKKARVVLFPFNVLQYNIKIYKKNFALLNLFDKNTIVVWLHTIDFNLVSFLTHIIL